MGVFYVFLIVQRVPNRVMHLWLQFPDLQAHDIVVLKKIVELKILKLTSPLWKPLMTKHHTGNSDCCKMMRKWKPQKFPKKSFLYFILCNKTSICWYSHFVFTLFPMLQECTKRIKCPLIFNLIYKNISNKTTKF